MITGDHLNIAKETARLIDLGVNIHPNTALWPACAARDDLILHSDGFAQVLCSSNTQLDVVSLTIYNYCLTTR